MDASTAKIISADKTFPMARSTTNAREDKEQNMIMSTNYVEANSSYVDASESSSVVAVALAVPIVGVVIAMGLVMWFRRRQMSMRSMAQVKQIKLLPLTQPCDAPRTLLDAMAHRLHRTDRSWSALDELVSLLLDYADTLKTPVTESSNSIVMQTCSVLEDALKERLLLLQQATTDNDVAKITLYSQQIKRLDAVIDMPTESHAEPKFESIGDGLLLSTDRMNPESTFFLGQGASATVSKGIKIDNICSKEVGRNFLPVTLKA